MAFLLVTLFIMQMGGSGSSTPTTSDAPASIGRLHLRPAIVVARSIIVFAVRFALVYVCVVSSRLFLDMPVSAEIATVFVGSPPPGASVSTVVFAASQLLWANSAPIRALLKKPPVMSGTIATEKPLWHELCRFAPKTRTYPVPDAAKAAAPAYRQSPSLLYRASAASSNGSWVSISAADIKACLAVGGFDRPAEVQPTADQGLAVAIPWAALASMNKLKVELSDTITLDDPHAAVTFETGTAPVGAPTAKRGIVAPAIDLHKIRQHLEPGSISSNYGITSAINNVKYKRSWWAAVRNPAHPGTISGASLVVTVARGNGDVRSVVIDVADALSEVESRHLADKRADHDRSFFVAAGRWLLAAGDIVFTAENAKLALLLLLLMHLANAVLLHGLTPAASFAAAKLPGITNSA